MISNGIKGLVILEKGEYSHDFADNTLLVCCFRVVGFLELLTRHSTLKQLTLQSIVFSLEFYFLISFYIASFKNIRIPS